jgi:hypothetical protein
MKKPRYRKGIEDRALRSSMAPCAGRVPSVVVIEDKYYCELCGLPRLPIGTLLDKDNAEAEMTYVPWCEILAFLHMGGDRCEIDSSTGSLVFDKMQNALQHPGFPRGSWRLRPGGLGKTPAQTGFCVFIAIEMESD